ncbi:uncharacterized protein N7477_000530 [Penicillium maclennaniae]|uniref:uncharacterized protein n=1 Tax=Penicillium maclennaniae TaxID=1343394 RepID=UPI002540EAF6|nr:uncharacterized protein N7477_000530 [Penicillium maclennaniae]KAJ5684185.1 hypothetical protein N7477_000530 [Penicillium maclennaniae]
MEPVPAIVEPSILSKDDSEPQVHVNELPLVKTRSGHTPNNLRRANTVAQGGNIIKRNLELKATRDRTATATTGLRAKDSHELLRQAPLQRSQTHRGPLEARPAPRRAGHFTVGSVGQNGKIFLRPIANPPQKGTPIVPFSSVDQVMSDRLQPPKRPHSPDDPSRWSSSQLSELRPRDTPGDQESVISELTRVDSPRNVHHRANSFSTISEQSVSGVGKRGELRIVIDRSEDRPKSADGKSGNTALEVPIPHYRLGSPRFNNEGNAVLRSSVYTRNSMSDNFRNSSFLGSMADPFPTHLASPYCRDSFSRHRPSFAVSVFSGTAAIDLSRASLLPRNSMVYELNGPVEPSIYENLISDMDCEAVVRYIPGTKDISAATPARIVAQISSESFMDYELVSDFFLTFRSYLSPSHLLALLLARLQWAINRLQDDGRIIRIRTFAALRHWILNYFVDDFITNYDLRTHFCETINVLYQNVKSRKNGGLSDLKILLDLKRCWNGKCSVYWTSPDLSRACSDPDRPIEPGNAQIELPKEDTHQQSLVGMVSDADANIRDSLPNAVQHDRNDSATTVQSIPFSTKSDQSMLALSCSLPPKSPRRYSNPYLKSKGPRPVQLGITKPRSSHEPPPTSPMHSRHQYHGHGHKRSGSFSDSARDDRVPMFGMELGSGGARMPEILDPVSFIRGALYPPAESYMTMMAPDSPPLAPPSKSSNPDRRSTPDGGPKLPASNSGVRTIIGSIKRALHTRNGGHSVSARIANVSDAISLPSRGKTSAMPNNVALGSEYYRERKLAAVPKRPARIDILCEEALKHYRQAMNNEAGQDTQPPIEDCEPQGNLDESSLTMADDSSPKPSRTIESKIKSGLTAGSGSIVIVDDTGFDFNNPTMSGGLPEPTTEIMDQQIESNFNRNLQAGPLSLASTQGKDEYLLPIYYNEQRLEAAAQQPHLLQTPHSTLARRSYSNEGQSAPEKRVSLSLRLRKYASFQSGISRHRLSMESSGGQSVGSSIMQEPSTYSSGPALRRRPGGNLRQIQYADELEPGFDRHSFASYDESLTENLSTTEEAASRPQTTLIPPNPRYSLLQSNQNRVRRSFESALARFAQIPDDDDGGIESTLLKLEGKWPVDGSSGTRDDQNFASRGQHAANRETPVAGVDYERAKECMTPDSLARRRQTDKSAYSIVGGRLAPRGPILTLWGNLKSLTIPRLF